MKPGETTARTALVTALLLALAGLVAGCGWRDGDAEDVAICVDACRARGADFNDLRRVSFAQGSKATHCLCKLTLNMSLLAADGGAVSR